MGYRTHSYEEALAVLNASIPESNVKAANATLRKERADSNSKYLSILGISEDRLKKLNIIHVAGSKGKGSTCAVVEHQLRHLGFTTGFLSSPHLINVEERIRINGIPLSRNVFADIFWTVHDQVTSYADACSFPQPTYLQYIILMACKAFVDQQVDATIIEVGMGGRYDHTNFFSCPSVCVVTSICLEHTSVLGNTLAEIAWKKAGIFKPHCYAIVSNDQPDEVMEVFVQEANLVHCPLYVSPRLDQIRVLNHTGTQESAETLSTFYKSHVPDATAYRMLNIELGLAAVHLWLRNRNGIVSGSTGLQPNFDLAVNQDSANAILQTRWPGRWQKVYRNYATYFIDGAHTEDSVKSIAEWFQSQSHVTGSDDSSCLRVLMFTVIGSRDPKPMLDHLRDIVRPSFDFVLFVNPHPPGSVFPRSKRSEHEQCLSCWQSMNTSANTTEAVLASVDDLTRFVKWVEHMPELTRDQLLQFTRIPMDSSSISSAMNVHNSHKKMTGDSLPTTAVKCHILVTGSLYLVGAILKALNEPV